MKVTRILKRLAGLKAYGPYLLMEMLLPGGTLLALLLWLSQRWEGVGGASLQRYVVREMGYRAAVSAPPHPVHPFELEDQAAAA